MIKVLLQVPNSKSWIGGLNYFLNLCEAVNSLPKREIEFIILGDNSTLPPPLCNYKHIHDNRPIIKNRWHSIYLRIKSKFIKSSFNDEDIISNLYKQNIKLFSHGYPLGLSSPVPSLCWIPDFQHRYLQQFFTEKEIEDRNIIHKYVAENSQALLFSSKAALNDFKKFHPDSDALTYVLHFVAVPNNKQLQPESFILKKYNIFEPFFHVPNQLWAHKNHTVVLKALKILNSRGKCPLVISTGYTDDYRNPDFYSNFFEEVKKAGLEERFRFLGLIDLPHVYQIMHQSVSLINPSLFEGWSSTVEEGKSIGKKIILSDIAVHREQSPERGQYFAPDDSERLANLMLQTMDEYDPNLEKAAMEKAFELFPARLNKFGKEYVTIVKDIIRKFGSN